MASTTTDRAGAIEAAGVEYLPEAARDSSPRNLSGESRDVTPRENDPMTKRETLELVRAYYKIRDYHVRRRIYELAKSLATTEEVETYNKEYILYGRVAGNEFLCLFTHFCSAAKGGTIGQSNGTK